MLLLYQEFNDVIRFMIPYLHSTMLLLYRKLIPQPSSHILSFTFHYASTLSRNTGHTQSPLSDLHSTMLLLYHTTFELPPNQYHTIYIPLCFYFIRHRQQMKQLKLYLHSTMLLLYLTPNIIGKESLIIYIPLCFYFISSILQLLMMLVCIYIPLCFYFIPKSCAIRLIEILFTFHYASTLSSCVLIYAFSSSKFTFHYASTLSED